MVIGGTGATQPEVSRILALNLRIAGSTMGTRDELRRLTRFCVDRGLRPLIDRVVGLDGAPEAIAAMAEGGLRGKIVLEP